MFVAIAFALYSLSLFAYFLTHWQRGQASVNTYLIADNQRRAAALAERLEEMRNEAVRHASLPEVRNFFLNRDLGMSMRYGLQASLQAIEERFAEEQHHIWSDQPSRIILLDAKGERLVDTHPDKAFMPQAHPSPEVLAIDVASQMVVAAVPVVHKGQHEATVFTLTTTEVLYRNLLALPQDSEHHELLLMPDGRMLPGNSERQAFDPQWLRAVTHAVDNAVVALTDTGSAADSTGDLLAVKAPVSGLPLFLVTLVPVERVHGHLASRGLLWVAGLVPFLLLFVALRSERMRVANLRLQTEKLASERERLVAEQRNMELAAEIRRREDIEAELRDRTAQLDTIFALSPDGFVSFDAEGRVRYVNPAFCGMTGLAEAQCLGLDEERFASLLSGICKPGRAFPGVAALRQTGVSGAHGGVPGPEDRLRVSFELVAPGNRVIESGLRTSTGQAVSQVAYFRDITREAEVDRMKSEFLSTAAHELRTPMTSVLGFTELLLSRDFEPQKRQEMIGIIHRHARLIAELVDELLDLARIEARSGLDFTVETLDASQLMRDAAAEFRPPAGRQAPVLAVPDTCCMLRGDRSKLVQVVNNLLSNGYKYSPGGGRVEVELVPGRARGDESQVGLCVRDHGIGMTPPQLARVFERFYRADTSGNIPGSGLGMAIVKEIVELHGGEVEIHSTYGAGTTVIVWLPAARHASAVPQPL